MKNLTFVGLFSLAIGLLTTAFRAPEPMPTAEPLKWYTWEEAVALNKTKPKKFMVDIYTDWCGWCKKMDKSTFADPKVTAYLQENFYPIKLDAEQKAEINFNNEVFKYVDSGNGRGIHTLAYSLLDGKLGYPTVVYLTDKFERIMISPGYKEVPDMMKELQFAAEDIYQKMDWEEFRDQ